MTMMIIISTAPATTPTISGMIGVVDWSSICGGPSTAQTHYVLSFLLIIIIIKLVF